MGFKRDEVRCSVCDENCNLWMKCVQDYVYKIEVDHKYLFQCSYHCWRIEKRREYERRWMRKD